MDPRGEPHVLDRARARPEVGVGEGGPPQHSPSGRPSVAGDDDPDRRLPEALELEVEEPAGTVVVEVFGLGQPGLVGQVRGALPYGPVPDHDEPPRLRMADTRATMARGQHLVEQLVGKRVRAIAPDVAATGDDGLERAGGIGAHGPAARVLPSLSSTRPVPDDGDGTRPGAGHASSCPSTSR